MLSLYFPCYQYKRYFLNKEFYGFTELVQIPVHFHLFRNVIRTIEMIKILQKYINKSKLFEKSNYFTSIYVQMIQKILNLMLSLLLMFTRQYYINLKMEQQLQAQIRKNKNLLNTNISLMEQNQLCTNALTKLKKFLLSQQIQEDQQTVLPDQAESLASLIIQKIAQQRQGREDQKITKTELKKPQNFKKQCQCQKWKDLYIKQSQQSYRLSKKISELEQNITKMQVKNDLQSKQMDYILKQYLNLFQKVNSSDFIQVQSQLSSKKAKQKEAIKQNKNQNSKSSKQKEKRSASKSKSQLKSNTKKNSKTLLQTQKPSSSQSIPANVAEQLSDFPNILNYLQIVRQQCNRLAQQNAKMREQSSDMQSLIRIYREKQRQRILYSNFLA